MAAGDERSRGRGFGRAGSLVDAGRGARRRERERRELRAMGLTIVQVLGYAVLIAAGLFVCGFVAFLLFA